MTALRTKLAFMLGIEQPHGQVAARALLVGGARLVVLAARDAGLLEAARRFTLAGALIGECSSDELAKQAFDAAAQRYGAPDVVLLAVACAELPDSRCELALRDFQRVGAERLRGCYFAIRAASAVMRRGTILLAGTSSLVGDVPVLDDERVWLAQSSGRPALAALANAADDALAPRGINVKVLWHEGAADDATLLT